jgi:hypothetical protein
MSTCPYPNDPQFKELVKAVGVANANVAYGLNADQIPTVEQALKLLDNLKIEEKDEQFSKSSDQFKLERAVAQRIVLEKAARNDANLKQRETIDKLIAMNAKQQEFLNKNIALAKAGQPTIKTVSVSSFLGSSDFKGDPTKYEAFKLFGTFMHEALELAQVKSLETGAAISAVMTEEFFKEKLDNYKKKNPFHIEELTDEMMFDMAKGLSERVNSYNFERYLILPEITVTGTTKTGTTVVGRLDLLMIDQQGNASIFDFKTKKVKRLMEQSTVTNEPVTNVENALLDIATTSHVVENKAGTAGAFQKMSRTAYDTWTLQLKVYENMLIQNDIPVADQSIVSLLYQTNDDGKFLGYDYHIFKGNNYYNYVGASVPNNNGVFTAVKLPHQSHLDDLRKIVDEEIPISEEQAIESAKRADIHDLKLTSENNTVLKNKVKAQIDSELSDVLQKISELENEGGDTITLEALLKRRETLRRYSDIITQMKEDSQLSFAYNFSNLLFAVEEEVLNLSKLANEAMKKYEDSKTGSTSKQAREIHKLYQMSNSLSVVYTVLDEVITEARKNEENAFVVEETIDDRLTAIHGALNNIEAAFKQTFLYEGVLLLKTPGAKAFERINADLEEGLKYKLAKLEEQLQNMKDSKPASFWKNIEHRALMFMDSSYKKKVAERLGPNAEVLVQMEQIQRDILKTKAQIGGFQFNDEFLTTYLKGITDPSAQNYAGRQGAFGNSAVFRNTFMDQFIASASNSELAIAAMTMAFKNADGQARLAIQNNIAAMKFDQKRDSLLKRFSVEELNDMMSEYRTYSFLNDKGEMETTTRLYMSTPYSEEYKNTFREYNLKMRQFKNEIARLKADSYDKVNTPEEALAKETYLAEVSKLNKYRDEYIQWLIDNTQLPYVEKFYSLQKSMPNEIRDKLQKAYMEMETIVALSQVGRGNEVLLEDHDFDRIKELEVDIRKLRREAKEINPEYAKYMDDFNELYEFDTNQAYFDRMRNSAQIKYEQSRPEKWEQWQKDNEIERPSKRPELPETLKAGTKVFYQEEIWQVKQQREKGSVELVNEDNVEIVVLKKDLESLNWYEEMSLLHEARNSIVKGDPEINDLFTERSKILAPYKVGRRLKPKFMSEDDIKRLDEIDGEIEMRIEASKSKGNLSYDQKVELAQIGASIRAISEKRHAQGYTDVFEESLKVLKRAQKELITAENNFASAEASDKAAAQTALNKAEENFAKEEKAFEKWYNLHHNNKYKSILTGHDVTQNRVPKSFNFENLPARGIASKYMEKVPHPKYKIKRIRESAKNPDFMQSAEGVPMPKAVTKNDKGHYIIAPGFENSLNINPKYKKMMADQEVFDFYNDIMDMYFGMQKKVEGRKIGYMVPGFAASAIENISRKGFKSAIEGEYSKFVDRAFRQNSKQDHVDGTYGDMNGKLRHRFTDQLDEGMQSRDAIGSIMKYTVEAQYNVSMQEVAPRAEGFVDYLELQLSNLRKEVGSGKKFSYTDEAGNNVPVDMAFRIKELEQMISVLRFEKNKFLYGQTKSGAATDRWMTKRLNQVFSYASFVRIGFDVANQTKNYISGNVQAFIAAGGLASDQYTRKDYMWAKSKVYGYADGFFHNYLADMGRIGDVSDSTMLYRFYNPAQKDFLGYMTEITGGKKRQLAGKLTNIQELGYMLQDKGDTEIAVTVMYAVMNHNRYRVIESTDSQGKKIYQKDAAGEEVTVPVHEIYYKDNNGLLQRRKDVEFDQEDENRIRNIIYSEMRRAQGNYAKADQTKIEETPIGSIMMFFKKYLVPQMLNRFGYLRSNWEAGEAAVGYWRAVGTVIKNYGPGYALKHMLAGSKHMSNTNANKLGALYSKKVDQARRDSIAMMMLTVLGTIALIYVKKKDEEDEELSFLEGNAIRVLWGVKGETLSMFPVGGGSEEYIRNFTTAVPLVRELTAVKKGVSHAFYYGVAMTINGGAEPDADYDSQFYQEIWKEAFYSRKSGAYEKGDAKIGKDFVDLTGLKNFRDLIDPNYRIDQLKRNQ